MYRLKDGREFASAAEAAQRLEENLEAMRTAIRMVVADYDRACKEKYDELSWAMFNGVDSLRMFIETPA